MTTVRNATPRVFVWVTDDRSDVYDLSAECVSFTADKGIQGGAGSWSVVLLPRDTPDHKQAANLNRYESIYQAIGPNTPISIGFDVPGGITFGFVSRVSRSRSRIGQRIRKTIKLSGMDMGKILVNDHIVKAFLTVNGERVFRSDVEEAFGPGHPLLMNLPGTWGPATGVGEQASNLFSGATLKDVADWILDACPSMRFPLLKGPFAGQTGEVREIISTVNVVGGWGDQRIYSETPRNFQGTIWGFLNSIVDSDFYEVRIDTKPRDDDPIPEIHLILRPKPFDEPALDFAPVVEQSAGWDGLTTFVTHPDKNHVIEERHVVSDDLGYGDSEALSYYLTTSQHALVGNEAMLEEGIFFPLLDLWAAGKFGMRSYQSGLTLIGGDVASKVDGVSADDVGGEVREFRNRLFNWYRLNPFFESGSMTVVGADHYRVGDPVLLPWATPSRGERADGVRFYCTGVTHRWSYGQHYLTTLRLERGHNDSMVETLKAEIKATAPTLNPQNYTFVDP